MAVLAIKFLVFLVLKGHNPVQICGIGKNLFICEPFLEILIVASRSKQNYMKYAGKIKPDLSY